MEPEIDRKTGPPEQIEGVDSGEQNEIGLDVERSGGLREHPWRRREEERAVEGDDGIGERRERAKARRMREKVRGRWGWE